jgi:hypothetical protein
MGEAALGFLAFSYQLLATHGIVHQKLRAKAELLCDYFLGAGAF